jgi:hypothetical protein
MKEIASFHIYSEVLAPYYEERYHCVPLDAFARISELGKVEEPKNSFTAQVEVGSDQFEEIIEILNELGAVLKDSEKAVEGPTLSVGRSIEFSAGDITDAKYLRLALKKEIIELDVHQWRKGCYRYEGKGKPSFKFGFADHTPDFAASSAFLDKLKKEGFAGIQALEIMDGTGEA